MCLINKALCHEDVESEATVTLFLTSALDGGELSVSLPDHFTPGQSAPATHWIGGWVGQRASLDTVE
jgi:hypothetical protein